LAVGTEFEAVADPGIERGRIARVDPVEARIVVRRLSGIVVIAPGVARIEAADGEAAVSAGSGEHAVRG